MNYRKELNLTHSKSKVQGWALFAIFGIVLALNACNKDNDCDCDSVEQYPSLKVVNQNSDSESITSISLVGYEFKSLLIPTGSSQTFVLDKGMPGGYNNIYIKVTYGTTFNFVSTNVNFNKGTITTITSKGCSGYEGCTGHYLEYNP